ncbi:uncharacterized protein HaLaN_30985, partial [Haematococcus lacustris]
MRLHLSYATIGSLESSTTGGAVNLKFLRTRTAQITTTEDNIVIEDERDTELRYRSAGNLLCAAAPLIEPIPDDLLACDMVSAADPAKSAHRWYDTTPDQMISETEFRNGLGALGLDFGPDSLALTPDQEAELIRWVFAAPVSSATLDLAALSLPAAQLEQ